jgi:hypothetical protein
MQRITKHPNSEIIIEALQYKPNGDNSKLRDVLFEEQLGYCAYTETYLGRSDKKDIDHFNPSKDFEDRNHYHNLFLTKAQWNTEKSDKWGKYQPVLHPTADDFEERIVYQDGDYFVAKESDMEAKHIYELLKLYDPDLASERKNYIRQKKELIKSSGLNAQEFFTFMKENKNSIQFLRAIQEEFDIDIKSILKANN